MAIKKRDVDSLQLRSAADFYIVPLENDHYTLTDEALKKLRRSPNAKSTRLVLPNFKVCIL
jgi:hypothetical protein